MPLGQVIIEPQDNAYARWWKEGDSDDIRLRTSSGMRIDVKPGMQEVKLLIERAVRFRGSVVDPDGHPVAGTSIVSVQRDVVDSQPIPVNRVVTNFGGGFQMDMGGKLFAPGIALKVGLIPKRGQKLVVDAKVADDGRLMIKLPGESSLKK